MPKRKTDAEWACKLAGIDVKLGQLAARREQLQARWGVEQRKRETRARRVLGDALLRHDLALPEATITLQDLMESYVAAGRDRDVATTALEVKSSRTPRDTVIPRGVLPPTASLRLATIAGSAATVMAQRRRQEQARIIIGGAVLRWARRSPDTPQSLRSLISCDVTRKGDREALAEAFHWEYAHPVILHFRGIPRTILISKSGNHSDLWTPYSIPSHFWQIQEFSPAL